jgi:hypothetical protein
MLQAEVWVFLPVIAVTVTEVPQARRIFLQRPCRSALGWFVDFNSETFLQAWGLRLAAKGVF